jgi:outer membrane autotransporter protein
MLAGGGFNPIICSNSGGCQSAGGGQPVLLQNAGLIDLTNGGTGPTDTLTLRGNYVGLGDARLALETRLGNDSSPSDVFVIRGVAAGQTVPVAGATGITITNVGGLGDQTTGGGILVVDAQNGATTVPGNFFLTQPVVAGPYEYLLFKGNGDPNDWYLRSTRTPDPDEPPCPPPTPEGPTPPGVTPPVTPPGQVVPPGQVPNFRPEVSLNAALPNLTLLYGRSIVGTLHERVGDVVGFAAPAPVSTAIADGGGRPLADPLGEAGPAPSANGAWGRVIAEHGDRDGGCPVKVGPSFDYGFAAVQAGFDAIRLQHASGARDRAGVYGVFGSAHAEVQSQAGADAGRDRFAAYTVGGYWTHYGAWDWYLDAVVQGTFYDVRDESMRLPALETDGWGLTASLEAGIPFKGLFGGPGLLGGLTVEPQAQLVYQTIDLDDSSDMAARVRFDDVESLAGRLGVRFATKWAMPGLWGPPALGTAWFRPSYWHEFSDDARTLFSSALGFLPFRANIAKDWVELNTGLTAQVDHQTALFASVNYDIAADGDGEAWEGKIGLKVVW